MKRFIALLTIVMILLSFAACGDGSGKADDPGKDSTPATDPGGSDKTDEAGKLVIKMADGTEKEVTLESGFYITAKSAKVSITGFEYQQNKPEKGFALLKLVLDGNKENVIVFMVKETVAHGDYALAWENAEFTSYGDILNDDGLFGLNNEWEMPKNLADYQIRVFDDKTADHPVEIGFLIFK